MRIIEAKFNEDQLALQVILDKYTNPLITAVVDEVIDPLDGMYAMKRLIDGEIEDVL
jgi:hypothetical protein